MENNNMEEVKGTKDLFLETLTRIGCQYEITKDEDEDITFGYHGEYFLVRTSNKSMYVNIYDTNWDSVDLYDIDEFTRLKKAINESNINNNVTTIYTINEAAHTADVHCKSVALFISTIPDIDNYLHVVLNEFFRAHYTVNMEMTRLRELETEK